MKFRKKDSEKRAKSYKQRDTPKWTQTQRTQNLYTSKQTDMQTQRHTETCVDQGINRDQKLIVIPTEKNRWGTHEEVHIHRHRKMTHNQMYILSSIESHIKTNSTNMQRKSLCTKIQERYTRKDRQTQQHKDRQNQR